MGPLWWHILKWDKFNPIPWPDPSTLRCKTTWTRCVYMYVFVFVYCYMDTYYYRYTNTYLNTYTNWYSYTFIRTQTQMCVWMYIYRYIHTSVNYVCTHVYIYTMRMWQIRKTPWQNGCWCRVWIIRTSQSSKIGIVQRNEYTRRFDCP